MQKKENKFWCEKCGWISKYGIYNPDGYDGSVNCLGCETIIGYTWDKEYKETFPDGT